MPVHTRIWERTKFISLALPYSAAPMVYSVTTLLVHEMVRSRFLGTISALLLHRSPFLAGDVDLGNGLQADTPMQPV